MFDIAAKRFRYINDELIIEKIKHITHNIYKVKVIHANSAFYKNLIIDVELTSIYWEVDVDFYQELKTLIK